MTWLARGVAGQSLGLPQGAKPAYWAADGYDMLGARYNTVRVTLPQYRETVWVYYTIQRL